MKETEALSKIKDVINLKLTRNLNDVELYKRFYIGKTGNPKQRYEDHLAESPFDESGQHDANYYIEMYELACGKSKVINDLEIQLINYYKKHSAFIANENQGGGGNPDAICLYVTFEMEFIGDKNNEIYSLENDLTPIADGFPIDVED